MIYFDKKREWGVKGGFHKLNKEFHLKSCEAFYYILLINHQVAPFEYN